MLRRITSVSGLAVFKLKINYLQTGFIYEFGFLLIENKLKEFSAVSFLNVKLKHVVCLKSFIHSIK